MSIVGDNIRKARIERGWTQDELAQRMGYRSKSTVTKVESGVNDITQSKVKQYAEVLGVSVSYLMGWEEEHKKNDQLAKLTVRMYRDPAFAEAISILSEMSPEELNSWLVLLRR